MGYKINKMKGYCHAVACGAKACIGPRRSQKLLKSPPPPGTLIVETYIPPAYGTFPTTLRSETLADSTLDSDASSITNPLERKSLWACPTCSFKNKEAPTTGSACPQCGNDTSATLKKPNNISYATQREAWWLQGTEAEIVTDKVDLYHAELQELMWYRELLLLEEQAQERTRQRNIRAQIKEFNTWRRQQEREGLLRPMSGLAKLAFDAWILDANTECEYYRNICIDEGIEKIVINGELEPLYLTDIFARKATNFRTTETTKSKSAALPSRRRQVRFNGSEKLISESEISQLEI